LEENRTIKCFTIGTPHQIPFGQWSPAKWYRWVMRYIRGWREVRAGFWWGNLLECDHLLDLDVDERIMVKRTLRKLGERASDGLIWLRIGNSDRLLWPL